jgi:hypothetical protein
LASVDICVSKDPAARIVVTMGSLTPSGIMIESELADVWIRIFGVGPTGGATVELEAPDDAKEVWGSLATVEVEMLEDAREGWESFLMSASSTTLTPSSRRPGREAT